MEMPLLFESETVAEGSCNARRGLWEGKKEYGSAEFKEEKLRVVPRSGA